jgi:hypothetical protein
MGMAIKLLKITHGQWLYRNVVVCDTLAGTTATRHKEAIQREIKKQQSLEMQDLQEEDTYLAEINLVDLEATSEERQEYWLISIQDAMKAKQLARSSSKNEILDNKVVEEIKEERH